MALAWILALPVAIGCASDPPSMEFSFVAAEMVAQPQPIQDLVVGKDCFTNFVLSALMTPSSSAQRADHGLAMADAMEQVPEANVLTDVVLRVDVDQWLLFQRTCAVVSGRAGRLP